MVERWPGFYRGSRTTQNYPKAFRAISFVVVVAVVILLVVVIVVVVVGAVLRIVLSVVINLIQNAAEVTPTRDS